MKSELFFKENKTKIENTVVTLLNSNQLMNYNTINSPRAVGDAVQNFLEKNIAQCLPNNIASNV